MAWRNPLLSALVVALLCVVLSATQAVAWWDMGHMTVAEVARRHMRPDILAKAEAAAATLASKGPYPLNSDFTQAALWPDDILSMGLKTMATWHYIQTPYIPADEADTFHLEMSPLADVTVMSVIPDLVTSISHVKATPDNIVTSVVNLIHYVGDSHQPLHSTNLFSSQYPTSELGGNLITVVVDPAAGTTMNLHAFWDSMANGPGSDSAVQRPLTAAGYAAIAATADRLEANWGASLTAAEKIERNSTVYTEEGNRIAIDFTYAGVSNGTVLTEAYKAKAKEICERRVLLAGYRLANLLNSALGSVNLKYISSAEAEIGEQLRQEVAASTVTNNVYDFTGGLSAGQMVGIAIGLFVAGVLLSVLVVVCIFKLEDKNQRRNKKPADGPTEMCSVAGNNNCSVGDSADMTTTSQARHQ